MSKQPHIIDGEFQSDKFPTCPRGKVPLSVKDPTAQDLLWTYAQRRGAVDAEFAADLETCLRAAGYEVGGRSIPVLTTGDIEALELLVCTGMPRNDALAIVEEFVRQRDELVAKTQQLLDRNGTSGTRELLAVIRRLVR